MRHFLIVVLLVTSLVLPGSAASRRALPYEVAMTSTSHMIAPASGEKHEKQRYDDGEGEDGDRQPGSLFCPSAVLIFNSVVIQAGRCYVLFVMHDARGTFLAFAAPDAKIPHGQLVRLSTPAGRKLKGRIFYLVPIPTTAAVVPLDSITTEAVRVENQGPRVAITLIGTPVPNLTVVFTVSSP